MLILEVREGPRAGERFELLDGDELGRVRACAAVVKHASVSRRHARVQRTEVGWFLLDLDSVNGIRVEGRRAERARLVEGAEILLGEVALVVVECDQPAEPVTASAAAGDLPARPARPTPRPAVRAPRRRGVLGWDLEQISGPAGAGLLLLAAALAAGLAWGAYRVVVFLRAS